MKKIRDFDMGKYSGLALIVHKFQVINDPIDLNIYFLNEICQY